MKTLHFWVALSSVRYAIRAVYLMNSITSQEPEQVAAFFMAEAWRTAWQASAVWQMFGTIWAVETPWFRGVQKLLTGKGLSKGALGLLSGRRSDTDRLIAVRFPCGLGLILKRGKDGREIHEPRSLQN